MSPKILPFAAGCTLLGLLGAATVVAAPQAPDAPATSPAPSGPPTVLLLTNGSILQGEIQKTEEGYVVRHRIGVVLKKRSEVVGTFRSLDEVYKYKLSMLPENDPDELMKLAEWCYKQKMMAEAKTQLEALLAMNPEDRRAKSLMGTLGHTVESKPVKDSEVKRTGAEMDVAPPAALNLSHIRDEYKRNPKGTGIPVVLDLPDALAVKRYQEFARTVHPILQNQCAKCHNEQFQGDFQLVQARARRDLQNELLVRTNLDATLRLVNPDDLARSMLLSASGMTHANGGKPALGGPNNADYRTLAIWVKSLKVDEAKTGPMESPNASATNGPSEAFAAGRLGTGVDPAMPPQSTASKPKSPRMSSVPHTMLTDEGEVEIHPKRAGSLLPGSETGALSEPPPGMQFPVSPLQGGEEPIPTRVPGKKGTPETAGAPEGTISLLPDGKTQLLTKPDGSTLIQFQGNWVPYVLPGARDVKNKTKIPNKELGDFMQKRTSK